MAILLVDTNIVSYANNEHSLWQTYEPLLDGHTLLIAAQSVAELRYGAALRNWGERRRLRLKMLMESYTPIYPNDDICSYWALIRAEADREGHPVDVADAWIAATALAFGAPLVTHNKKDFENIDDLQLISESP